MTSAIATAANAGPTTLRPRFSTSAGCGRMSPPRKSSSSFAPRATYGRGSRAAPPLYDFSFPRTRDARPSSDAADGPATSFRAAPTPMQRRRGRPGRAAAARMQPRRPLGLTGAPIDTLQRSMQCAAFLLASVQACARWWVVAPCCTRLARALRYRSRDPGRGPGCGRLLARRGGGTRLAGPLKGLTTRASPMMSSRAAARESAAA